MDALNSLISKLDKEEVNLVRNYLQHLNLRDKGDQKLLSLFDFLVKNKGKDINADACSMHLYGAKSDGRFRAMKFKLRTRLIDALISDKNIERQGVIDPRVQTALKTRKKSAFLNYVFNAKGNIPIVAETIEEILSNGIKYEQYVTMIDALRIKKYTKGFCKGLNEFNEINKQIAFYEYCDQARFRASDNYYKLITRTDFRAALGPERLQQFLEECIEEMRKDFSYTGSGIVGYYLKLVELAYFQGRKEYTAARNAGLELLRILQENPSVNKKQRVGIAFLNIGECDIFLGDYEKAISNFRAGKKLFVPGTANHIVAAEIEFKGLFYSGLFAEAGQVLDEIKGLETQDEVGDFKASKFDYYALALQFSKGKFREALKGSAKRLELTKDKTGWGIWVRIMSIMCNMELERFDEAMTQVASLRKHIERNESTELELTPRDKTIVSLLSALSDEGFLYSGLSKKVLSLLNDLFGAKPDLSWQPMGPELIPFHSWLAAKIPSFAKAKAKITSPAMPVRSEQSN